MSYSLLFRCQNAHSIYEQYFHDSFRIAIDEIDEVEYLCGVFGVRTATSSPKHGRIGIMDSGKLITLGTLQELRSQSG